MWLAVLQTTLFLTGYQGADPASALIPGGRDGLHIQNVHDIFDMLPCSVVIVSVATVIALWVNQRRSGEGGGGQIPSAIRASFTYLRLSLAAWALVSGARLLVALPMAKHAGMSTAIPVFSAVCWLVFSLTAWVALLPRVDAMTGGAKASPRFRWVYRGSWLLFAAGFLVCFVAVGKGWHATYKFRRGWTFVWRDPDGTHGRAHAPFWPWASYSYLDWLEIEYPSGCRFWLERKPLFWGEDRGLAAVGTSLPDKVGGPLLVQCRENADQLLRRRFPGPSEPVPVMESAAQYTTREDSVRAAATIAPLDAANPDTWMCFCPEQVGIDNPGTQTASALRRVAGDPEQWHWNAFLELQFSSYVFSNQTTSGVSLRYSARDGDTYENREYTKPWFDGSSVWIPPAPQAVAERERTASEAGLHPEDLLGSVSQVGLPVPAGASTATSAAAAGAKPKKGKPKATRKPGMGRLQELVFCPQQNRAFAFDGVRWKAFAIVWKPVRGASGQTIGLDVGAEYGIAPTPPRKKKRKDVVPPIALRLANADGFARDAAWDLVTLWDLDDYRLTMLGEPIIAVNSLGEIQALLKPDTVVRVDCPFSDTDAGAATAPVPQAP